MSMSVYVRLSVREDIFWTTRAIFTKFCVAYGCGSVLFRRRCDTLRITLKYTYLLQSRTARIQFPIIKGILLVLTISKLLTN